MDIQNFKNGNHRFPASTDALDFMQNQIFLAAKLTSIAGTNVIIKPATASQDGLVIIEGELLPLQKGTAKSYINIVETPESITAGTITFDNIRIRRVAQYATSGYAVSRFTTIDTIVSLMARVSAIEGSYMTETAIRTLVTTTQNTLQNAINTIINDLNRTNANLNGAISQHNLLANRVTVIENNYKTETQINELLAANAQHHLPKGSIIDWYGVCRCAYIPYGFVPCGWFGQDIPEGQHAAELAAWQARYPNNISISRTYDSGRRLYISACNGQTVPNLTDRFIVQAGHSYGLGSTAGEAFHKLTTNEMPRHAHKLLVCAHEYGATDTGGVDAGNNSSTRAWIIPHDSSDENAYTGGDQSHENRPPFYALYKLIKVI